MTLLQAVKRAINKGCSVIEVSPNNYGNVLKLFYVDNPPNNAWQISHTEIVVNKKIPDNKIILRQ